MEQTPLAKEEVLKQTLEYLQDNVTGVLSWSSPEGHPQSATLFFWVNDLTADSFKLYFVTRRHTRKFMSILKNPWVSMVVGTEMSDKTFQLEGQAVPMEAADGLANLTSLTERMHAKPHLRMLYGGAFFPRNPFAELEGDDFAVVRVTPTWARLMHRDRESMKIRFDQVFP